MDTVIVSNGQFYSHYPKNIAKGTVDAEAVLIRLDSEWEGLTVRTHWLNVASGVEKVVLLELDQPNTIPWEVLTDLGELRMGMDGMDGGTIVKPTVWLTYGYVVDGVDPESGSDPQPPTPSWEQQMVEQARVAAEAAEEAKAAAVNAEKAASQAGPYADEAQKSAEAAKEAQRAASTSAQEAGNAKDQANTASNAAKVHADAAGTAKLAAERAAETAGNAQSGASQSAKDAAGSASDAQAAKHAAEAAAAVFPPLTEDVANKILAADSEGKKLIFIDPPSGGGDSYEWRLIRTITAPEDPTTDQSGVTWFLNSVGKINGFEVTADDNGNPFRLDEVIICGSGVFYPNSGTRGNLEIYANSLYRVYSGYRNLYQGNVCFAIFQNQITEDKSLPYSYEQEAYLNTGNTLFTPYGTQGSKIPFTYVGPATRVLWKTHPNTPTAEPNFYMENFKIYLYGRVKNES